MSTSRGEAVPIHQAQARTDPRFDVHLTQHGVSGLVRTETTTLQINVGKRCNQTCRHCHVEAGPHHTEVMADEVAARIVTLLDNSPAIRVVDVTGGAPELSPRFRWLVTEARRRGLSVVDRCNLTVFFEPGLDGLPQFLAENQVEIAASLPCYTAVNVDKQRGNGVFEKSVRALRLLNGLGYGRPGSALRLNLVYNPLGASLPPAQHRLEADYRKQLGEDFGIEFNRLFTITNMPIKRFAAFLEQSGKYEAYMSLLVKHFNPGTVESLMCRSLVSAGWDGQLYDCDFNQMLDLSMPGGNGISRLTIWDIESFSALGGRGIGTGAHCFGCTAGPGSSCGGALQ